jgi:uncharacterized protein involved in exopolysaccharide biosynthesis
MGDAGETAYLPSWDRSIMDRYSIPELIRLALRRFFWVFIPFIVLFTIGLVVLSQVPERFHSRALLIVINQQVSENLVPSAVQAAAQDRLQTIKAELRARDNVIDLARQFNLLDPTSERPFSQQVEDVRDDIRISIEKVDTRRFRRDEPPTVTFEIGFVHENPRIAYRVANELVTDFMSENVEARIEAVEGTAEFLRSEARNQERRLNEVRRQIADYRNANIGMTPDSLNYNQSLYSRLLGEIERLEQRIESNGQSLSLMRMQQPLIIDANERSDLERVTLNEKRRQLSTLRGQFTDTYPEVVALTGEVLELESRLDPPAFERRAKELLDNLNARIADREGLSRRELSELRERRDKLTDEIAEVRQSGGETSMARLQFQTSEQSLIQQIDRDQGRIDGLRGELAEIEATIAKMPAVAARLDVLETEEKRLLRLFEQTQSKLFTAEQSESLEEQQKAEKVQILEAPIQPDTPTAPNKPMVALAIASAAGGLSAALAFLPILLAPKVDTGRQLGLTLPGVTVVEVPEIVDTEEQKFRRTVFIVLTTTSILLTAVCAFVAYKALV